ncbi:MAG: hypothetical protein JWN70_3098 [Planctomycetaceae bacterium]|nr:hypothetical protein [Planctomycetaceae bacterium]
MKVEQMHTFVNSAQSNTCTTILVVSVLLLDLLTSALALIRLLAAGY